MAVAVAAEVSASSKSAPLVAFSPSKKRRRRGIDDLMYLDVLLKEKERNVLDNCNVSNMAEREKNVTDNVLEKLTDTEVLWDEWEIQGDPFDNQFDSDLFNAPNQNLIKTKLMVEKGKKSSIQVPKEMTHARQQQEMSLGESGRKYVTLRDVWQALLPHTTQTILEEILQTWDARGSAWRNESQTTQATKRRLVLFWAVSDEARADIFNDIAQIARPPWTAATMAQYWQQFLATAAPMKVTISATAKQTRKNLQRTALLHPAEFPKAISPEEVRCIWQNLLEECCEETALCLQTTWSLAGRFADVSRLLASQVRLVSTYVALTFTEGKVVSRIGPWSLHLPLKSEIGEKVFAKAVEARNAGRKYVFGDVEERRKELRKAAISVHPACNQHAIRRGAVQEMSRMGHRLSTIQMFTRHRSLEMTQHYLNKGAADMVQAKEVADIAEEMWNRHSGDSTFPL